MLEKLLKILKGLFGSKPEKLVEDIQVIAEEVKEILDKPVKKVNKKKKVNE